MKWETKSSRVVGVLTLLLALCAGDPADSSGNQEPSEADITRVTANLLEGSQFLQLPLDDELCGRCLDLYRDALDGARQLFLQADVNEFAALRPGLAAKTLIQGDTHPAHIIFTRYLERLAQQVEFAVQLLHDNPFTFTGHDAWQIDRHDAAPPGDLAAAQALWQAELREEYLVEKLAGTPVAKIAPKLTRRYRRKLQIMGQLKSDEVLGLYLDAMARAFDPHSDFLGHPERENFKIEMNMELFGIGGALEVRGGYSVITDLVPGGPAANSGKLKLGDRIVAVAQYGGEPVDIMGMTASQVVELIRGPKGTAVRLTIIPAGAPESIRKTVTLVREEIKLADQYTKATIIYPRQAGGPALRIGVINLPLFYGKEGNGEAEVTGAADDAARLIRKLKQAGVDGLILDLRHNGGGSLEEAIRLTGLFIPSGPVVQALNPQREVSLGISPQVTVLYDGPLVVLTSRWTASASEIVAGALQDYGRALIVGDSSTFGKGTMQNVVLLRQFFQQSGLGAIHVTVGKFYRPSGASTQLKGVVPDIILPSDTDLPDIGESQLPNALPWDTISPTTYAPMRGLRPQLSSLREKSQARVAADPGFRLVRLQEAMVRRNAEAKWLTLNEADRRSERAKADEIAAELNQFAIAKAVPVRPAQYITLVDPAPAKSHPVRKPGQIQEAAMHSEAANLEEDLELGEAENILADYIQGLQSAAGGPAAAAERGDAAPITGSTRRN